MTVLVIADLSDAERARLRDAGINEAHAAGRIGLPRVPDEALFPGGRDPSDSQIAAVLLAFEAGQLERRKP